VKNRRALLMVLLSLSGCGGHVDDEQASIPCPEFPKCGKIQNPDGGQPFCPDAEWVKTYGCLG